MSLVKLTQQIVGREYNLGAQDCFRVVYDYIAERVELPEAWRGINVLEDYPRLFESDPHHAKELAEQFLDDHLTAIDPALSFAGDILMLQQDDNPPFPAIHAGNQHFIGAEPKRGVAILPLRMFEIKRAWRCR